MVPTRNYVNSQKTHWLGRVISGNDNGAIKIMITWKRKGKRPLKGGLEKEVSCVREEIGKTRNERLEELSRYWV